MQNLGLAWAVYPALCWLYPAKEARQAAVLRHLSPFNTHPYVAAAIVGGVLFHEERIARGEEGPERVEAFKRALMGPLAALGDGFFWLSLKPAVGALCCALVPLLGAWAAVLFVVLYNVVHLQQRVKLFRLGVHTGDKLVEAVAHERLPTLGRAAPGGGLGLCRGHRRLAGPSIRDAAGRLGGAALGGGVPLFGRTGLWAGGPGRLHVFAVGVGGASGRRRGRLLVSSFDRQGREAECRSRRRASTRS